MPKISRFFGYWIKKHCFIPKNSICTPYRYMQNELSSLAAGLPLSPSPGAGRQLPQSSLETAWSCTQHPVCIPIKEGFSMLQIKKPLIFKGFSGDGGIRTHVPGISRQTHFESFPPCDFWWKLSEDGSTQRKPKSCGILRILASVFRFYLNPQGFPSSSHFCPEL